MSRPRVLLLGAALLVLLIALTPFIPRGAGDGGLRPSGHQGARWGLLASPGAGRVTPAMRDQIAKVVDAGLAAGRASRDWKDADRRLVDNLVRCADFDGQRYCLGLGWTDETQAQARGRMLVAARARTAGVDTTGDLDSYDALRRTAALSPAARAQVERTELTQAARSVAKVWVLRHEIQGVPLPPHFLRDHPEARVPLAARNGQARATPTPSTPSPSGPSPRPTFTAPPCNCSAAESPTPTATPSATTSATTTPDPQLSDYPTKAIVLDPSETAEQTRTYWCGPTAMQMIAWGWKHVDKGQDHWASALHTTTGGTSITDMVRVTNGNTGWDLPSYAGKYVVLDVGDFTFRQWLLLNVKHIAELHAPLIYHPILLKRFYPYLDHDESGHFQVGRGYLEQTGKPTEVSYFEPFNQQRFDPSLPYIKRVQWRDAYRSYRANLAHPLHNIGA